ncbi:tRNA-specific adenosine deaminase [Pelobium manganitolerans]|uniref:tRNA-specific adenosine deaminase n=1 Tax=Pelobium manganitolerans TaxID=1842495 RepID=A0A419SAP3_9SPHI|nr:nucleoside deaminase [Pelobium manganitolerans]RKD19544.1 tRNA-specific adenosine deaminase [Pelobium manganitolerans]
MEKHEKHMRQAIALAEKNLETFAGGPFGTVIVKDGKVIAAAANTVNQDNDPTAHAEVNAIRQACKKLKQSDLKGATLYTSAEPCPMCLSAIYWANIAEVYYGNLKEDAKWAGFSDEFIYDELAKPIAERALKFHRLLPSESMKAFETWVNMPEKDKEKIKNGSL